MKRELRSSGGKNLDAEAQRRRDEIVMVSFTTEVKEEIQRGLCPRVSCEAGLVILCGEKL